MRMRRLEEGVVKTIILASGSPRRAELMRRMVLPFKAIQVDVDEHLQGAPKDVVSALAQRKARAAQAKHPDHFILAADTLVHVTGETLGKPRDRQDAMRMLRLLSGREHQVLTGVCVLKGNHCQVRAVSTRVRFVSLDDKALAAYVDTGEPMDKAGAYAIQGMGGMYVEAIQGSPSNVIGLPMHTVRALLTTAGYYD